MRRQCFLAPLLLLALSPALAQTTLQATRAAHAPLLDGKLDDPCWAAGKPVSAFLINNTTEAAKYATSATIVFDDHALYLGVKCAEPRPADILTEPLPRDNPNVWRNDCVEFMLDPTASQNDYYHIAINAAGQIADRACTQGGFIGDMSWDSTASGAAFIGPDYWSAELTIPWSCLGLTPAVGPNWRVNICREKRRPGELSALGAKGAFNIAAAFVPLQGLNTDFSRYCYDLGVPRLQKALRDGKLDLTVQAPVRNATGKAATRLIETWLTSPSGKVFAAGTSAELPTGQDTLQSLGPLTLAEQGEYTCYVRVADPVTKQPLAYRKTALDIRYVPVVIKLLKPWYRHAIFASQNLKQIELDVEVNLDEAALKGAKLEVALAADGAAKASVTRATVAQHNSVVFPNTFAVGDYQIVATLKDAAGKAVAETTHPLRKLAPRLGEVWLSDDLQWQVDGKPFFLTGAWNYPQDFLPEYNAFTGEKPGCKLLDTGLMNVIAAKMTSLRESKLSEADAALVREFVARAAQNPTLFAYYTSDEPEVSGTNAKALAQVYELVAELDPYHPVIISNDSLEGLRVYADCADLNGLHPYPVTLKDKAHNDLAPVVSFTERAVEFFKTHPHKQTIAYLHQGFNYGDYGAVNNRIPNYLEYRNQNLVALICGARGTIQFNRMVAHYPELYLGMPYLTKELAWLEPILSAPDSKLTAHADSDRVKLLLKEYAGQVYLLAGNADNEARDVKLTLPRPLGKLNVISEARSVTTQGETLTDHFGPWECHLYTTAPAPALKPVAAIVAEIDQANDARRKPGNLVFQQYEGDGVVVSASSNKAELYRRPDTGLWHVVDGIIDQEDRYHALTWQDKTEGASPDWLEIQLPQPQTLGRVEVYPFQQSLRDYAVQVWVDGQWREVAKVAGQSTDHLTHTFAPVTTDRVRLFVTATNGKSAMVTELEVYAK